MINNQDLMNKLNDRTSHQATLDEHREREKHLVGEPGGDDGDDKDYSWRAQRRMRAWRTMSGLIIIAAILRGVYWIFNHLF